MKSLLPRNKLPLIATILVFVALFAVASFRYDGFFSLGVILQLVSEKNAVLGIAALGMTFVILSGGIDLSVGSLIALSTIGIAVMVEKAGIHPALAWLIVLAFGSFFGAAQGGIIQAFRLPPFLVTLAGMFMARGMAFMMSPESIGIGHRFYDLVNVSFRLGETRAYLSGVTILFLLLLGVMIFVAHHTRFGRIVYALGGSEDSAALMGLPVVRTKVWVYGLNGFFAALAGVAWTIDTPAGNPTWATGMELFVIAVVVIGGTRLSGGVGNVVGTLVGVMVYATIELAITFDGSLSASMTSIAIGVLLLVFIGLQRLVGRSAA